MEDGLRSREPHVTWPSIVRTTSDELVRLYNPGHGTSLDVEPESVDMLDAVLAGFACATTPAEFLSANPDVPRDLLVLLVRSGFVVEAAELPYLEHGFLRPAASPIGTPVTWSDLPAAAVEDAYVVIGIPTDMGAMGKAGARHGPSELRHVVNGELVCGEGDVVDYELKRLYRAPALAVADLGDIEPDGGRMDHVGARLRKAVREVWTLGMRPLLVGGDHSLTHFVLAEAIARGEPFGIMHFDAHADMGPSRTLSHANIFGEALASPLVTHILQGGLRGIERMSPFARRVACTKRRVVTARDARAGLALQAISALPTDIPYYLSFDIDCVDAAVARETGAPLFGGLSFELCTELVDHIARNFRLLGADFVEVSGPRSELNASATIAASLVQRCLLAACPYEALGTDIYEM
jgi:arginase family enzyme